MWPSGSRRMVGTLCLCFVGVVCSWSRTELCDLGSSTEHGFAGRWVPGCLSVLRGKRAECSSFAVAARSRRIFTNAKSSIGSLNSYFPARSVPKAV